MHHPLLEMGTICIQKKLRTKDTLMSLTSPTRSSCIHRAMACLHQVSPLYLCHVSKGDCTAALRASS